MFVEDVKPQFTNKEEIMIRALIFIVLLLNMNIISTPLNVDIATWKGDASASFSLIMDDFGSSAYTQEIIKAGNMASERGIKIASAAVVFHMVSGGEERWDQMNSFIAQGHEIVNHSWLHASPTGSDWDMDQDMQKSKDSLEAHLDESVWQKEITFFAFPEDAGRDQDLAYLKEHGYLGARVKKGGNTRINANSSTYDPFHTDFYGYISREYLDAVYVPLFLEEGKDTSSLNWWMTYPDQPYPPYNSFETPIEKVEQRHLELALMEKGWGLMEMHSIAPEQVYPTENPWWSPMSYTKFETLLDKLKLLQEKDSLWVDIPSKVASYIVLSNNINIETTDSTIDFIFDNSTSKYLTELTLKIATKGESIRFTQSGNSIESYTKGIKFIPENTIPDTVYIDVNPAHGSITFYIEQSGFAKYHYTLKTHTPIHSKSNHISLTIPAGNYSSNILNLQGQKVINNICGISDGKSPILIPHSLGKGIYFIQIKINKTVFVNKIFVGNK